MVGGSWSYHNFILAKNSTLMFYFNYSLTESVFQPKAFLTDISLTL